VAGVQRNFTVIGNDVHGNQRAANDNPTSLLRVLRGSGSVQELVNVGPAVFVFNAATNDYTATYTVIKAGELEINVYFSGVHIAGSPRRVIVSAAPTSANETVISGSGTSGTIVGRSAGVTLQAYDSYGNIKSVGGDAFRVSIIPAGITDPTLVDNNDGTYEIVYTPSVAGDATLAITLFSVYVGNQTGCNFSTLPTSGCQVLVKVGCCKLKHRNPCSKSQVPALDIKA